MPPRPSALVVLLALLAAFGLVACGSDEEDSASDGNSAETSQEAPPPSADTGTETEAPPDLTDTTVKPVIDRPSGTPPRRLVKEDIVKGKGPGAQPGDTVIVNYVGVSFSTGEEFDASWDTGQPFPVQLGAGKVIEGWEKGLIGIKKGGRRELIIPPEQAYGAEGAPPSIGPNETLVFVIDALEISRRS
jgi:peptidylprolyl isomerase